jgi:UDPglucose 6-dehydrogenase
MKNKFKITVFGSGYVGLGNGLPLSFNHRVTFYDIDESKIQQLGARKSPYNEKAVVEMLNNNDADIIFTSDLCLALSDPDIVIIATSTFFDDSTDHLNVQSIVDVVKILKDKCSTKPIIIIKSTVGLGFTERLNNKLGMDCFFVPEFLQEGNSIQGVVNPERIVIGYNGDSENTKIVEELFLGVVNDKINVKIFHCTTNEAELIKLGANGALASRLAYFYSIDNICLYLGLDTRLVIDGICFGKHIGSFFNIVRGNFSGMCLVKDPLELYRSSANLMNSHLLTSIPIERANRNHIIATNIMQFFHRKTKENSGNNCVGIYRIIMKPETENWRSSHVVNILKILLHYGIDVVFYEPFYREDKLDNARLINNLDEFKNLSTIIFADAMHTDLVDVFEKKVFTRDTGFNYSEYGFTYKNSY